MNQTVVGIFETAAQAQQAAQRLAAAGFTTENVDVSSSSSYAGTQGSSSNYQNTSGTAVEGAADAAGRTAEKAGDGISNFFSNLFGGDDSDDARRYSHVARNSGSVVTVHAHSDENARRAAEILDDAGAVDVDERASQTGYQYGNSYGATATGATTTDATGATAQVIEENLQVGKRVEQTGGARLRSRIVERPVEANVRLREEHVNVERRPVDRPATEADFAAFKEGEIEITESAERAVVAKEARVVEEVSLGKEVTEREETIRDTVRKTEVDVERLDGGRTDTDIDPNYTQRNS
ncbi:YsnF/AvaK domain-containing protein [Hymenobacter sp. HSC-4F20]|uniref:YsnF/AvaK domain-containing protein n=1 Tax=Hymenobacter sp. HSC-4F20 TaxID=2864135 RepID=UPI001C72CCE9|nr:YsnF/AvaK domain-containing protein [Hymenobacter sp. HSC-4F20]MBX0291405.1 YsnF/AvaK domain-containing protein [Hymenobacter sp. HSC-4F20]